MADRPFENLDPYDLIIFLQDMGGFVNYRPEIRPLIVIACLGLISMSIMIMTMIAFKLRDWAKIKQLKLDKDSDSEPDRIYEITGSCALEIYGDGCSVSMLGASVSGMLHNIINISCRGDIKNRIIEITCADQNYYNYPPRNIIKYIRCGEMSEYKCRGLMSLMLRHAGG